VIGLKHPTMVYRGEGYVKPEFASGGHGSSVQ
jgi:hypothetical protein